VNGNVSDQNLVLQFIDSLRHGAYDPMESTGKKARPTKRAPATRDLRFRMAFGRKGPDEFAGYMVDGDQPARRYVVQLLIDGVPLQLMVADQYDEALARQAIGDGCHGFSFIVPREVLVDASVVEARIANTDEPVGKPVLLENAAESTLSPGRRGVRWLGGLRLCGWLDGAAAEAPKVTALIDGAAVAEVYARGWHHVGGRARDAKAVPAFDLHLPARFADGCVRLVRIVDELGEDLPGSPLTFVAFDDGLEGALSSLAQVRGEQLRGELFDRLIPASLPMAQYGDWRQRFPAAVPPATGGLVAVVFIGDDDEIAVQSLEAQTHTNWVAATLPANVGFDCKQLEHFVAQDAPGSDVIVFAVAGMQLEPNALATFAEAFQNSPGYAAIYADFALRGRSGELWPVFLPAFDYERMLEQGCGALLFATRRKHLQRALTARPTSLFHLFQTLVGNPVAARNAIGHLPGSLGALSEQGGVADADTLAMATAAHLDMRGVAADVVVCPDTPFPSVRVMRRQEQASVSIIIPTRNQVGLLRRCIETIMPAACRVSAEIIVVDNDSAETDTLDYLASVDGNVARVLRVAGAFNFSRLNNLAVSKARGDQILLLNNDIEALDDQWLDEMIGRMMEPDVGAVGATLLWPSGIIQHAGVVLGPSLGAAHAFTDRVQDDCGYAGMLNVAREVSAVTAACLLTRKTDYLAVGGLDEVNFPVNFNDVDYCLKLRALGRRIVVSPHARLLHLESASRGTDQRPDRANRLQRELRALRARWLETIVDDPYYNPLLSLDPIPFSALAWPPRSLGLRLNRSPRAVDIPRGL
jgi:GT2 family glycosyltransferase